MRSSQQKRLRMNIKKSRRDPRGCVASARLREDNGFRRRNGADGLSSGLRISLELVRVIADLEKRNFSVMVRMKALFEQTQKRKEKEAKRTEVTLHFCCTRKYRNGAVLEGGWKIEGGFCFI